MSESKAEVAAASLSRVSIIVQYYLGHSLFSLLFVSTKDCCKHEPLLPRDILACIAPHLAFQLQFQPLTSNTLHSTLPVIPLLELWSQHHDRG